MIESDIIAKLVEDWVLLSKEHLCCLGYDCSALSDPSDVTAALLNVQRHRVSIRPRRLVCSVNFSFPTAKLDQLFEAVTLGRDLSPFQSKLHGPYFNDHLLNDWGIQHFHLVPSTAGRTRELLFAWITDDVFYAIAVLPHELADHRAFEHQELIETVHSTWPSLLASFRCLDAVPGSLSGPNSPEGRKELRAIGTTMGTQVRDGTVYVAPGGGVLAGGLGGKNSRGLSFQVGMAADRMLETLIANQKAIASKGSEFIDRVRTIQPTFAPDFPIPVRLAYRLGGLYLLHEASGLAVLLTRSPITIHTAGGRWLLSREPGSAQICGARR